MATNVKLGVEVSEFTKGMKEAQDSVKLVNAMLKQNEAQLKLTGDAEATMEAQTTLLNAKLEQQKKVAEQAEKALQAMKDSGVDPTSKAYKDMMLKMVNAQTAAKNTEAELKTLGDTTEKTAGSTKTLGDNLKEIGGKISLEQTITGIEKITGAIEKGAKAAYKLGKSIVTEVLGAGSWADELQTTAKAYGITPEELQRMQKTAEIIDTSADDILKSKQKLAENTDKLSDLLGIDVGGKTIDDAFWETGEAIMALGDAFEQEEIAQKIFGKSWRDLVPLFSAGREEYERINDTWSVVSDEQLESLQKLDDQYQTLKADLQTLKMETLSQLAEPMANVLAKLNEFISSDEGQKVIGDLMGTLKDALQWITNNSGAVVTALTAIGTAFGLMKVSEGVLTVVKLFDGLKGLLGGGKGGGGGTGGGGAGWFGTAMGKAGGLLKTFWTTGGGASTLTPLAALALGIMPAVIAHGQDLARWQQQYNARVSAATQGGRNAWFIQAAADAFGTEGQVNFGTAEKLLMGLSDRQGQQKAELYNLLKGSTTAGYDTWNLLNMFWNGETMDQHMVDELLQNITDVFAANEQKVKVPMEPEVPADAAQQISEQIGTVPISVQLIEGGGAEHSFANGIWSVPYDGMLARLHKGERVVPARQAGSSFSSNLYVENMNMSGGLSADALAASIASRNRRVMAGYGS